MSQQQSLRTNSSTGHSAVDFPTWVHKRSQYTNRSVAGSQLVVPSVSSEDCDTTTFTRQAQEWGMHVVKEVDKDDLNSYVTHLSSSAIETDMRSISGEQAMEWAEQHMPVLQDAVERLSNNHDVSQLRIAMCLILEPKTAILARKLTQAGAQVSIYSGTETLNPKVAQQLQSEGIKVYSNSHHNPQQLQEDALDLLDTLKPNLVIDDGASFARLAARERPQLATQLIGVAEETTSGVRAFEAMENQQALPFPVVAVNDSLLKTGFDNAHGTGETCITTIQELLGSHCFQDTSVVVLGYGPVGRGFALRARTLGSRVTICDTDSRACLQAVFEGFPTRDIDHALPTADMVISATGMYHTINLGHMQTMKAGAILGVIGGIKDEIALDDLPNYPTSKEQVSSFQVPNGPELTLLSSGDGINYTAGGGNPIEIMDLSFAVQVSAIDWLLENNGNLKRKVYRLPARIDQTIALAALHARGYETSHSEDTTSSRWQITRFDQSKGI